MKQKHTFLRRALSLVLSFAVVFPATLALIGDSGTVQAAGTKTSISVLAIEPSDSDLLTKATVAGWTGYATSAITITYMSSLEFAGNITDLEENYDLIYVGDNGGSTSGLNLDTGLLYSSIGSTFTIPSAAAGLTDSEYSASTFSGAYRALTTSQTSRYSGNDLSTVKLAALNEYAVSGHPVIMANSLTNGDGHMEIGSVTFKVNITSVAAASNITLTAAPFATAGTLPSSVTPTYKWYKSTSTTTVLGTNASYTVTTSGSYYCTVTYTIYGVSYTATSDYYTCTTRTAGTTISDAASTASGAFYGPNTTTFNFTTSTPSGPSSIASTSNVTFSLTRSSTLPTGTTVKYEWYLSNTGALVGSTYSASTPVSITIPVRRPTYGTPDTYYCEATVVMNDANHTLLNAATTCRSRKNITVTRSSSSNNNVTYASPTVSPRPANGIFPRYYTFTPKVTPNSGTQSNSMTFTAASTSSTTGITTAFQWVTNVPNYTGSTTNSTVIFDQSTWAHGAVYTAYCYVTVTGSTTSSAVKTNTLTLTRASSTATIDGTHPGVPKTIAVSFVQYTINTAKVDNCSNMYAFLDGNKSRNNVMCPATIISATLLSAINLSKPTITLSSYPAAYTDVGGASLAADTGSNPATYTLSYTFTIANDTDPTPADTTYYCYLYADSDANGLYRTDERLSDIVIKKASDNTAVASGELNAGISYVLTRQLPSGTAGIIPWKLELIKTTDESVHTSKVGYSRAPTSTGKAKVLNILQINASNGLSLDNASASAPYNTSNALYDSWNTFQTLFGQVASDYDINVQTVTPSAVNNIATSGIENKLVKDKVTGNTTTYTNITDFLNSYGMILLGVGGSVYDLNVATVTAISDYLINKPVLYTYGTTSAANVPMIYYDNRGSSNYPSGTNPPYNYYINNTLRSQLGIDRFGITDATYGHTKMSNPGLATSGLVAKGYVGITADDKTALQSAGYSIAYTPKSTFATLVPTTQGFSNYISSTRSDYFAVSQVNKGQISSYPFNINTTEFGGSVASAFDVEGTSWPYYQLNMNSEDTVVWYCLNDGDFKNKDAANAYYIYRSGNATFSGFGYWLDLFYAPNDTKLFVNTIIAAYGTATTASEVKFSDASGSKILTNFLMPTDDFGILTTSGSTGKDRNLYFTISGGASIVSATIWYDPDEPQIPATIYDSTGTAVSSSALESNQKYYVKIDDIWNNLPSDLQDDFNSDSINVIPITITVRSGSIATTAKVYLRKLLLFNLS